MKASTMVYAQPLRAVTLFSTLICLPLAIASTVVSVKNEHRYWNRWARHHTSNRPATALCFTYFSLTLTAALAVASLYKLRRTGKALDPRSVYLDLFAFVLYLSVLVPIWVREIGELQNIPGYVLLATYTTVPMIINMILHAYVVLRYMVVTLPTWSLKSKSTVRCANCKATVHSGVPQEVRQASKAEGYSLLRGEDYLDEDAVQYKDARDSEDLLRSRASEDTEGAEGVEVPGKGKIALDV